MVGRSHAKLFSLILEACSKFVTHRLPLKVRKGSKPAVLGVLSERLLSDPKAAIANCSDERPFLADFRRCSGITNSDPNRSFKFADANVGYRIAKRPSNGDVPISVEIRGAGIAG